MPKAPVLVLMAALAALALPGAGADPSEKKAFQKSHPFVGDKEIPVGVKHGDVTIESVRIRNWPDADDLAEAERDLNETHTMVVEFTYSNRDEVRDYKCRYVVTVPGKDGVWAENDRTATLDKGKVHDTNKLFLKMKTRYYKQARSLKVSYEIWRK